MTDEEKKLITSFGASRSLRQGLELGTIGVIAARAGVGKSSCLVQIALDELVSGGAVLHVSLDNPVAQVRHRYNEQFKRIARNFHDQRKIQDLQLQVEQLRHIHSYLDGSFSPQKLASSVVFLQEHMDLEPNLAVIDGYSFCDGQESLISEFREVAAQVGLEVWLAALTHRSETPSDINELPPPLGAISDSLDAVIRLEPNEKTTIGVSRWRRGEVGWQSVNVWLEPKTMVMVEV